MPTLQLQPALLPGRRRKLAETAPTHYLRHTAALPGRNVADYRAQRLYGKVQSGVAQTGKRTPLPPDPHPSVSVVRRIRHHCSDETGESAKINLPSL